MQHGFLKNFSYFVDIHRWIEYCFDSRKI